MQMLQVPRNTRRHRATRKNRKVAVDVSFSSRGVVQHGACLADSVSQLAPRTTHHATRNSKLTVKIKHPNLTPLSDRRHGAAKCAADGLPVRPRAPRQWA